MHSYKELLDRIVIASLAEMPALLDSGQIGAVISANEPDMMTHYEAGSDNLANATAMMERIVAKGIPHYKSSMFELTKEDKAILREKVMAVPESERKALRQAETARHTRETLAAAEELLERAGDKKLAIHCQAGSDRSATFAIILLLNRAGGTANIDQVLSDFARIRPNAQLRVTREDFKGYFGDQYERFHEALGAYRDAVQTTGKLQKAYGETGLQIERGDLGNVFNVTGLNDETARATVTEQVARYNEAAKRFGLTAYKVAGV